MSPMPPMMSRSAYSDTREHAGGPMRTRTERRAIRGEYMRSLRYALGLIWSVRPGYVVLNLANLLWNIPSRILNLWIIQFVVNTATGSGDFASILTACAAYLAFLLVRDGFQSFLENNYNVAAADHIRSEIQLRLHARAKDIDLAAFDTRVFYDDYARALDVLDERVIKCFTDLVSVLSAAVSILTVGSVMATMSWELVLIVSAGCLAAIAAYSRRSRVAVLRNRAITPLMRRFQYLNDLYYERRFAKDVRSERIDEIASADHQRCTVELDAQDRRWGKKSSLLTYFGRGAGSLTDVLMYAFLAWGIIVGRLDAGSFVALANASWQFSSALQTLFRSIPELGETCLLISDSIDFDENRSTLIDPPDGEEEPAPEQVDTLAMEAVDFSYVPGRPVLHDVSFSVQRGQMLAIVGHNGAGKSTLAKLLLRLYDPDQGQVYVNGLPYMRYRKDDLRRMVAVVFQDYQHYAYSVAENVLMRPVESEIDRERVRWALDQVGLLEKVQGFAGGLDAHVTREFSDEGELFSGGELQRLAIARALAKDAPVVVMDEPSSALDPVAEREVAELMAHLFSDRICIVVSHRLSMTRDADCILVMEEGRVVEQGPHDELLAKSGAYARLWEAQAEKYAG